MNDLAELHQLEQDVLEESDPLFKKAMLVRIEELKGMDLKPLKPSKPQKEDLDINRDGVFDKKDKVLAGKVLASGKKHKR